MVGALQWHARERNGGEPEEVLEVPVTPRHVPPPDDSSPQHEPGPGAEQNPEHAPDEQLETAGQGGDD
jgi:hypothetical protein